jgi:hypothetical protein
MSRVGLAELGDASHFHDRRFLLSICKVSGLLMIRVDATKSFAVVIKDGDLPVMVLTPPIFSECCASPNFHLEEYYHVKQLVHKRINRDAF